MTLGRLQSSALLFEVLQLSQAVLLEGTNWRYPDTGPQFESRRRPQQVAHQNFGNLSAFDYSSPRWRWLE